MNELALFAGAGGGILGGHLLGWRTVCAVEWGHYPACVLVARQNDRILPAFPVWDDVQTFDGRPWRGIVEVISGGFPCQDISSAGKGAGISGARSGMWSHMARIIGEVRPRYVFVENSPMLVIRGLGTVLGDLAALGFDARWGVISAADVGAPHQRDRIWIVATNTRHGEQRQQKSFVQQKCSKSIGKKSGNLCENISNADDITDSEIQRCRKTGELRRDESSQWITGSSQKMADASHIRSCSPPTDRELERQRRPAISSLDCQWWDREPGQTSREIESGLGRVVNGVAAGVDRLKAIGNGQVSLVAATAWSILIDADKAAALNDQTFLSKARA